LKRLTADQTLSHLLNPLGFIQRAVSLLISHPYFAASKTLPVWRACSKAYHTCKNGPLSSSCGIPSPIVSEGVSR